MEIPHYLAMTAAEFQSADEIPGHFAWMACHFSSYGTNLANLPSHLPKEAILMVNDRTPIHGHDGVQIYETLTQFLEVNSCRAIVLDFQQPVTEEAIALCQALEALPCPVYVPPAYLHDSKQPVFLPPLPPLQTIEKYISSYNTHPILLELALDAGSMHLDANGSAYISAGSGPGDSYPHTDKDLALHYRIEITPDAACFHFRRTMEDIATILSRCYGLGDLIAIGLWQEWQTSSTPS